MMIKVLLWSSNFITFITKSNSTKTVSQEKMVLNSNPDIFQQSCRNLELLVNKENIKPVRKPDIFQQSCRNLNFLIENENPKSPTYPDLFPKPNLNKILLKDSELDHGNKDKITTFDDKSLNANVELEISSIDGNVSIDVFERTNQNEKPSIDEY